MTRLTLTQLPWASVGISGQPMLRVLRSSRTQAIPAATLCNSRQRALSERKIGPGGKCRLQGVYRRLTMAQAEQQHAQVVPRASQCRSSPARRAQALCRRLQAVIVLVGRPTKLSLAIGGAERLHGLVMTLGPIIEQTEKLQRDDVIGLSLIHI